MTDKPTECANGCPEKQVCDYCQSMDAALRLVAVNREVVELQERIRQLESQSVAVVGEPVAWVRRHPDGALTAEFLEDAVIEPVRRNSGGWLPLFVQPTNSITAAELATLRARLEQAEKDAEKWRDLCSRVGADPSGTISYAGPLEGAPEDWAAIAQDGEK